LEGDGYVLKTAPSHLSPLYPIGQMHLKSVTTAVQVPPFLHGLTPQGSIAAEKKLKMSKKTILK